MNIEILKKRLGFIDVKFFPEQECAIKDSEPNIFKSKNEYLIMICDSFTEAVEFVFANPYIYKTESGTLYGWSCAENYGNYIGNNVDPIRYGEFVVAFKKIENKFEELNNLVRTLVAQNYAEHSDALTNCIKSIFTNFFQVSSVENFPSDECTEELYDVLNGEKPYLCLIADLRFSNRVVIRKLYPYKFWEEKENRYTYGWSPKKNEGDFVDNVFLSVHGNCWDEYAVAFAPYFDEFEKKTN